MVRSDFIIKYNPETDTTTDISYKILYSIFIKRRIKAKKPAITFIGGDSGEGKSLTVIALQTALLKLQGLDIKEYLNVINVYTPLQYPEKLDRLLFDKKYKKINMIGIHEARDVIKAKDWNNFVTQAVADVNAQSRSIKRLIVFIISQFIRDITTDIRYTLNFYCTVWRPVEKKARLYINVMWKDDTDLEKPKLRKRRLSGFLVYPNGKYKRYKPDYIEITKPPKEIIEAFEKADKAAKASIIKSKLNKLIKAIEANLGIENKKTDLMLEYYSKNYNNLKQIAKVNKAGKWKLNKDFKEMHSLTSSEALEFQALLNARLQKEQLDKLEISEKLTGEPDEQI